MEKTEEMVILTQEKKIVLFGETHGTKEIPEILSHFFIEIAKKDF